MTVAREQLKSIVERILNLKSEQDDIALDIREIYAEAKSNGFDKTVLGQVISHIRKQSKDPEKFAENEAIFDLYLNSYNGIDNSNYSDNAHTHETKSDNLRVVS